MMKRLFIPVILIAFFAACDKEDTTPTELVEQDIYEIQYGDDILQHMDVYLPADRTSNTKLLVFIHGGGWNTGDKSDFTVILSSLKGNGFAYANLNYRLANAAIGITLEDQAADIRAALDLLIAKSTDFVISPDQIIIAGHSAGGHLALYTAYHNNGDGAIKAAISLAGPTDVTDDYFVYTPDLALLVENMTGTAYAADSTAWANASPVNFVTPVAPPTLLQYCGLDFTVPASQGEILSAKLAAMSVEYQYQFYPFYSHDMGTIFFGGYVPDDVKTHLLDFINTHAN